jgi:hypothetical protein
MHQLGHRNEDDMRISPPTLALGITGAVGLGATLGIASTETPTARKVRQGTTVFGLAGAGVAGMMAIGGGISEATWAVQKVGPTGMTRTGQLATIALGIGAGVAAANAAAEWVLDIDNQSLAGS